MRGNFEMCESGYGPHRVPDETRVKGHEGKGLAGVCDQCGERCEADPHSIFWRRYIIEGL